MKNDIHILWVSKYRYLPDSKVARHTHTFYHYLYMAKGSGHIRLEQESMELETGTIYLIPPYVDHEFVSGKAAGMTSYEIKFEINAEGLKKQIDRLPLYLKTQDDQILNLMDKMVKETDYKLDMHEEMTALLFSELIILLQRCSDRHEFFVNDEQSNGANHEFDEILMYMRSHIHKRIKLEDLAKKMCLEKTYFVKKI